MSGHVALLGDSVFDNGSYVGSEPEVSAHLRELLGASWKVTLVAVDGTTTTDIGEQLDRVAAGVTRIVLSVGGNDALQNADLLDTPVRSTGHALELFEERLSEFDRSYRHVLEALADLKRPVVACTVYNGNLDARDALRARVALMMFNDVIARAVRAAGFELIELRDVCTEVTDFANPIEPSGRGGRKIAAAVASALGRGAV